MAAGWEEFLNSVQQLPYIWVYIIRFDDDFHMRFIVFIMKICYRRGDRCNEHREST